MNGSALISEIEQVLTAIDDPALTATAFARSVIKQIGDMDFSGERSVAIHGELLQFAAQVRVQGNSDATGLRQSTLRLLRRAQELARPILPPSPSDVVRACFSHLQEDCNWASLTIDLLPRELRIGEKIIHCDADGITTNERRIDRLALIDRYRPIAMTENHFQSWREMHTRSEALVSHPAPASSR
jgi:hypothetical protein